MPMCTYLNDTDHTEPTSDQEINTLLKEVRQLTCNDWRVAEEITRGWFNHVYKAYTLYNHVQGPEFQIVNFYEPNSSKDNSIHTAVGAECIAAYFYGLLSQLGV